uniref:Phosphatase and actin regulator 3b n=1 Tax=Paramormyrops kingsleyae TaxID=1676925 RepID=A0A3B3SX17_9TELE
MGCLLFPAALGGKAAVRQNQDELVRKGLAKMVKADSALACGTSPEEPGTPTQEQSDGEEREEDPLVSQVNLRNTEDLGSEEDSLDQSDNVGEETENEKDGTPADSPACSLIGAVVDQERAVEGGEDPPNGDPSPSAPPAVAVKLLTRLGSLEDPGKTSPSSKTSITPKETPWGPETVRIQGSTPTGSPHLGVLQPQLPPSCIIEELHRALATKHRQDSLHGKEIRSSPKRRSDGRLSRTSSTEKESAGDAESKKESDENKENLRLDEYYSDTSGLLHDQDSWNESVISGTLPRRMRKELLAIKLRNRPSKQELEDRNIFPTRSDQERQEIRQQIEMKLANISCILALFLFAVCLTLPFGLHYPWIRYQLS